MFWLKWNNVVCLVWLYARRRTSFYPKCVLDPCIKFIGDVSALNEASQVLSYCFHDCLCMGKIIATFFPKMHSHLVMFISHILALN